MKKLINQNKVILFSTKYIKYTIYEVSLKNTLYLHRLRA